MPPHILSTSLFASVQPRSTDSTALNKHKNTSLCTEQYTAT